MTTIVLKFGGSTLQKPQGFARIAKIIAHRKEIFSEVIVMIGSMEEVTSDLLALAQAIHPHPPQREIETLMCAGESISSALLATALKKNGLEAVTFTGIQAGIITCSRRIDARIIDVKPYHLITPLQKGKVVIVAGLQGLALDDRITRLGFGGSDAAAVALASAFAAKKVEFYQGSSDAFMSDSKINPTANPSITLSYEEAIAIVKDKPQILHERCIELAATVQMPLHILSDQSNLSEKLRGTWIYEQACTILENRFEKLSGEVNQELCMQR